MERSRGAQRRPKLRLRASAFFHLLAQLQFEFCRDNYLPRYSPQLNPEERLNADLKQQIGKRVPVRTKLKLRQAANEPMTILEQNPERMMSYFQDRRVRYAA